MLHFYARFVDGADDDGIVEFLLTAAAVGILFKLNASISGAEVGCQGEVGLGLLDGGRRASARCSAAAPAQVENAAEIGIEHNLGLTCDPVGGLVQIPCIERNAIASVKADQRRPARAAAATASTRSPSTRRSRPCARPAPT